METLRSNYKARTDIIMLDSAKLLGHNASYGANEKLQNAFAKGLYGSVEHIFLHDTESVQHHKMCFIKVDLYHYNFEKGINFIPGKSGLLLH